MYVDFLTIPCLPQQHKDSDKNYPVMTEPGLVVEVLTECTTCLFNIHVFSKRHASSQADWLQDV